MSLSIIYEVLGQCYNHNFNIVFCVMHVYCNSFKSNVCTEFWSALINVMENFKHVVFYRKHIQDF